jgi:hypothetical protein
LLAVEKDRYEINQSKNYMSYFRTSSELSFVNKRDFRNPNFESLDYWQGDFKIDDNNGGIVRNQDFDFLYDVYFKILCRGVGTFPSYNIERLLVDLYGGTSVQEKSNEKSIIYETTPEIVSVYNDFSNFSEPWLGNPQEVEFDPDHPENERRFFEKIIKRFGPRIAVFVYPQTSIETILQGGVRNDFVGQRVDFLLMFPNGKGLIIEPGGVEHDEPEQAARDRARDTAFSNAGIQTLRPRNEEITGKDLYDKIARELELIGAGDFLKEPTKDYKIRSDYLFLLPSLISRIEYTLIHYCLGKKMLQTEKLRIGIIEQDLACAEVALISFFERINKLIQLYALPIDLPKIELYISRKENHAPVVQEKIEQKIRDLCGADDLIAISEEFPEEQLDLVLDVSIKSNYLLKKSNTIRCGNFATIRNSYRHNTNCHFSYLSIPKSVTPGNNTEGLLADFLCDFFRKRNFREGQYPIIKHILEQKNTIGLLPTSGGKSICYQLSSLLTPGVTVVIDPIVALMQDQVESLQSIYRITRVFAWYAGQVERDADAGNILQENLMVFIAPERFLAVNFRQALRGLAAADVYINYAVADEAHCVSMWGHDFRSAYLSLERHIREYCTFRGRPPVIVGLTGTASQLVLIDLKIELGITELDAIIRPNTFDRPELIFRIFRTRHHDQKFEIFQREVIPWIENRGQLDVQNLLQTEWGLIFTAYPNPAYALFGRLGGRVVDVSRGIYVGSKPRDLDLTPAEWSAYKSNVISSFKQGDMHLLVGNKSVGVGLDNEKLNWVVNYEMPSSLEEYYQACGRAGRAGQRSACALIFSDDNPAQTEEWLRELATGEIGVAHNRWDDIGIATYFHENNFPGKDTEIAGAYNLFTKIFREKENNICILNNQTDGTEKYILYWVILGVLTDYTKSGWGNNTTYTVTISNDVINDAVNVEQKILDSLCAHLARYKPIAENSIRQLVSGEVGARFSEKVIRYLISFIYNEIVRQRKASIRTMWEYCNTPPDRPELLRNIILSYFDRSKFSDRLDAMARTIPNFEFVNNIIQEIERFDDVERLYWETNRLSSQNLFRADWGAINLFALLYREREVSENASAKFMEIVDSLHEDPQTSGTPARSFIISLLSSLLRIDQMVETAKSELIVKLTDVLYDKYALEYIPNLGDLGVGDEIEELLKLCITNKQLSKLIKITSYERAIRKN